jgi:diguanylate cyclase (GGDEF)-like protein
MPAAITHRTLLLFGSGVSFALVTVVNVLFETPGLGLTHLFYFPIALAALAGIGALSGGVGLLATGFYCVGVLLNPRLPSHDLLTLGTLFRSFGYVSTGLLIGWFANSNRRLVEQLRELAARDYLTGLQNVRAFEEELARLCAARRRFAVLIGDLDGLKETNDRDGHAEGNRLLLRVATALTGAVSPDDVVARIGGDEFGLLVGVTTEEEAAALATWLERELERHRAGISFGWAFHPDEGGTPTELFRRADERLYRSKAERKSRAKVVELLRGVSAGA